MAVAPCFHLAAFGNIVLGVHHGSSESVEHADIFRSVHDAAGKVVGLDVEEAAAHVVDFGLGHAGGQRLLFFRPFLTAAQGLFAFLFYLLQISFGVGFDGGYPVSPVGIGVANHLALSVDGSVGSLHHQFCPSVTIEVVYHKRLEVGTAADVMAQVDTPEPCAVEPVAVYISVAREPGKHIVLGVSGVPFQENLVLSVAVNVAYAGIVGDVGVAETVGRGAAFGFFYPDGQIAFGGIGLERIGTIDSASAHFVGGFGGERLFVSEEGAALLQLFLV